MGMGRSSLTFRCYRQGLIALNIMYMVVGLILIIVPVYSKVRAFFTSWPIVGGTISCGVFIMLIALAGIYGTMKHHQIILFFYMAIMVVIFIILFSISVAALSISSSQEHDLLKKGWGSFSNATRNDIQKAANCCGFEDRNATSASEGHPSCEKLPCCKSHQFSCSSCITCYKYVTERVVKALRNAIGGIGLFFSFTLFLGVYLAFRFRHLKDPRANPSAFL